MREIGKLNLGFVALWATAILLLPVISCRADGSLQPAGLSSIVIPAPEPAAAAMSGVGLAGLGWYVRSRGRKKARSSFRSSGMTSAGLVLLEHHGDTIWGAIEERGYLLLKRFLDIFFSGVLLVLLLPLFLVIGAAVYINSPGPVFYRQNRLGLHRKPFKLIKFRSMCVNADRILQENEDLKKEFESLYKLKNDPRITKVGAFLRKTSLDELPQFFNVLIGDISLVGPRPIVEAEVEKYWPFEERLFSVKPGVSGLWQISGRNDTTYDERVGLDMKYIAERSTILDLYILFSTVPALLKKDNGAY